MADEEIGWYNALMAEHHSLGVAASGRVLRYVGEAGGVPVVLGTFGSAAWRVPARDEFIGWDSVQRAERLERVVSNQRLCVLPAAEAVPHAASRALAGMLRRLPGDYLAAFGVRLAATESFRDHGAPRRDHLQGVPGSPRRARSPATGAPAAARITSATGSRRRTGSGSSPRAGSRR